MRNKKGSTLLLVVGFLALLIVFSIGIFTIANRSFADTTSDINSQQAYFIAKATLVTFVENIDDENVGKLLEKAAQTPKNIVSTKNEQFGHESNRTYWLELVYDAETMIVTATSYGKVNDKKVSLSADIKKTKNNFFLDNGAIILTGYADEDFPFDENNSKKQVIIAHDDPSGALNANVYYNSIENGVDMMLWKGSAVRGSVYANFAPNYNNTYTVDNDAVIGKDLIVNGTVNVKPNGIVTGTVYAREVNCSGYCGKIVTGNDLPQFDIFKQTPPKTTKPDVPNPPAGVYSPIKGNTTEFDGNTGSYYEFSNNEDYLEKNFTVNTIGKDIHFKNADAFFNKKNSSQWTILGDGNVYFYADNDLDINSINITSQASLSPNVYILGQKDIDIENDGHSGSLSAHLIAKGSIELSSSRPFNFSGSITASEISVESKVDCVFYPLNTAFLGGGGSSTNSWQFIEYKK